MNSKRSMWTLVFAALGACVLVTNCTVKSDDSCTVGKKKSGCECPGNAVGSQTCLDDGTYGACDCPGTNEGGSSNAGASSSAGASSGGASYAGSISDAGAAAVEAGAGGEAGSSSVLDPTDCYGCLTQRCPKEWADCAAEDESKPDPNGNYCLSSGTGTAAPGQIEAIMDCITIERAKGLVKRDVVRACGSTIGMSADPQFFVWAPEEMTAATEQLVNCMADAPDELIPGSWATDTQKNFPASGPRPWDDMTCAKLACTSAL